MAVPGGGGPGRAGPGRDGGGGGGGGGGSSSSQSSAPGGGVPGSLSSVPCAAPFAIGNARQPVPGPGTA